MYETSGQTDKAIKVYREIHEDEQDGAAASRLANLYLKQEKYDEALPYLEAARAGDPEDLNIQVKLGLVQMELKKYEEAIKTFEAILKETPGSDRVHYYLGSLYEQVGKLDQAVAHLKAVTADSKLFNQASQVCLVRNGNRTVLTMANDFQGDPKEFAMVIPVPTVIKKEDVKVLEKALLDHVDAYTAPRLVEYWDEDPNNPRPIPVMAPASSRFAEKNKTPTDGGRALGVKIEQARQNAY
jgi:tetratricopeptide (TPR) repeat protein